MPGSKSITNRALVLAAIAEEPTTLHRPLRSWDTDLMVDALRALGVEISSDSDTWVVSPRRLQGDSEVDVGLAGTVMRFVPPLATLADGTVRFDGDVRARERPLHPLIEALRALGADIDDGGRGALPIAVLGRGHLPGGAVELDASSSSQLLSALLLAAPRFDAGVSVRHVSSAAPFLAAALVVGGSVRMRGWPRESLQAGATTPPVLAAMGARCTRDGDDLVVTGDGAAHGVDVDLADNPELACVLAAVAAVADTPSTLRGIGHMRGHETDRLAALARELNGLGGHVTELPDGLRIEPARLHGGVFHTYDDHRLAMAAAVVGLVVEGVDVENVATTAKTFPDFTDRWTSMLHGDAH